MVNVILFFNILAAVIITLPASGQKWYRHAMKGTIAAIDTARTADELMKSERIFERTAVASPGNWLPVYYQSLTNIRMSRVLARKDRKSAKRAADKALRLAKVSDSLSRGDPEAKILQAYALLTQVHLDSALLQENVPAADSLLMLAAASDPSNPRVTIMQAISVQLLYRGDERKLFMMDALGRAQSSLYLHKPPSDLHPAWGKKEIDELLKTISKN